VIAAALASGAAAFSRRLQRSLVFDFPFPIMAVGKNKKSASKKKGGKRKMYASICDVCVSSVVFRCMYRCAVYTPSCASSLVYLAAITCVSVPEVWLVADCVLVNI
jgi:hypothetical protein